MTDTKKTFTFRAILQVLLVIFAAPIIPMVISGQWNWWQAWAYAIASSLTFVVGRVLAGRRHPDLLAERARFLEAKDTKSWDKILAPLLGIGSILILVVAGLDRFYGWSYGFSTTANVIGLVGVIIGYAFSSWALIENRFFSGTVRIQYERGHHVVTTGPYRLLRHPGYAGGMFGYIFIPVLLDSVWAYLPTVLLCIVMIVRTALEDRTLQEELPGYKEFTKQTRYRLFPGIW